MNEFVSYLNSINNIGGNSTGSLAEKQVKSKYFDMVKVNRRLGEYIANSVKSKEYKAFILTGHAGDGKTSILVQVLKTLGYLDINEGLEEQKEYEDFYYVKDMSEIAESKQIETLEKALSVIACGKTSLIISNTGPLLYAFTALEKTRKESIGEEFSEDDQISLQSTLLTQLDRNEDKEVTIAGYKFLLINIARVDNVRFSSQILGKIVDESLWEDCADCTCKEKCPILNNRRLVYNQLERVSNFVECYYRYLFENDKRMTIRQMAGQLSYAITGNLSCTDVSSKFLKEPFFNYNFANLFFGFCGIDEKKDATQVKGIEQLRYLEIDKVALNVDYRLFVNRDLSSFFTQEIQDELKGLNRKYRKHYEVASEDGIVSPNEQKAELKFRRAIRRFYLIFGLCQDSLEFDGLINQIFGANFADYKKNIENRQPSSVLKKLQMTIFQALYMKNTGSVPNNQTELPLALRREGDVYQNVMLVLGNVSRNDLKVIQKQTNCVFEDQIDKQVLYLQLKNDFFKLSFPMINYFQNLVAGAIASNNNPALTHGIATLETLLLENFGDQIPEDKDDCEMRVLINTTRGQEYETFSFSDKKMNVW